MLYCYAIRKKAAIGKTALRKLLRTPPVAFSKGMYRSDKLFEAISKSITTIPGKPNPSS